MSRKVILSRKGFDGTTGGKPSPIINNRFVSLPIPRADSGVFYKDLYFSPTESYLTMMKGLGIGQYSEAHLDPDLQKSILKERSDRWRGLFGQSGSSQGTLHNRNVGNGDIFLFFGWFKGTKNINGEWKYDKNTPDIHAIYGYLEVDKVLDIGAMESVPPWASYHPHIKDNNDYDKKRNSVYIATKLFSANKKKQGWGCFNFYNRLVLTKNGAKYKSLWELPPCFHNEQKSFTHSIEIWNVDSNGWIEVKTSGRGDQEMYVSSNPEVVAWAENMIGTCSTYETV